MQKHCIVAQKVGAEIWFREKPTKVPTVDTRFHMLTGIRDGSFQDGFFYSLPRHERVRLSKMRRAISRMLPEL